VPRVIPGNILMKLLPVIMIVAMLGMVALLFTVGGAAGRSPLTLLFPMMMMFSMVGMFGQGRGGGQKKAEMNEDRKDYLRYLGQMRDRAREASLDQRAALEWVHPDPQALWSMATSRRMWERRQSDPDFCHLRAGRGSQRLATSRIVGVQVEDTGTGINAPTSDIGEFRWSSGHERVDARPIESGFQQQCRSVQHGHQYSSGAAPPPIGMRARRGRRHSVAGHLGRLGLIVAAVAGVYPPIRRAAVRGSLHQRREPSGRNDPYHVL
jgi:hypothetical protein